MLFLINFSLLLHEQTIFKLFFTSTMKTDIFYSDAYKNPFSLLINTISLF